MAIEKTDRTTLDMFATEKRRGRPRTNPLPREEQLRINKRNQIQRDRSRGLKRIELKVSEALYNALNDQALDSNISRSQLIESILLAQFNLDSDHLEEVEHFHQQI
ncbi:LexA regulated protein [Ferrimonas balearica DSM 9799]|uniref:LexA regulated protein n=2 Tax=Ferrimonas balearica TaxID=44012 RepID=E1SM54_FERBD|nr:LexA regulated protein [Ferrimonas balearica]MBY6019773.1 LexA regulated protein [Halomonas denitrificans]ADN76572.1 LexA regulated protein [Ferrimonas balearica DSM 9799]MBW3139473.1 LexA regulated protein [Ferrimonas balearica]MBW3162933.1 LexA regulated protein [Ferrimonas balearica]MBY5980631.1 LexA regulated protein [Ferrimonas balearica]